MMIAARALPSDAFASPIFPILESSPAVPRAGGLAAAASCGGRFFCHMD
jgi:hypothetical protein